MALQLTGLHLDKDLGCYTGACRLDGREIEVTIHTEEGSADLPLLILVTESVLGGWPALHPELCQITQDELLASGRSSADDTPELQPADVLPFSFSIEADPDGEVSWSVGLEVPRVLAEDEYIDVSRAVSGAWTTSEVRSTE